MAVDYRLAAVMAADAATARRDSQAGHVRGKLVIVPG